MATKKMWMVRAGAAASEVDEFRSKGVVAIGWYTGSENWTRYDSKDRILEAIAEASPDNSDAQTLVAASQIERFLREFQVGDRVVTYDPDRRAYLVGTIEGSPKFDPSIVEAFPTYRKVSWSGEVSRDSLSVSTRNSLGAISTLFKIPEAAAGEIESLLAGKHTPPRQEVEPIRDEAQLLRDVQGRSLEFIKDKLSSLGWEQMQQLVAGLLRAMGYKTRISPVGPDRGKDIVASPDGFGFESPKIVVEVKHRRGSMGSQEIRSFLGGRHKDDKGLYVSTGGFSKEAHYEAERSSVPLTLMDLDDLALAVTEYYDRMDAETRALLPLIRVYWPA